MNKCHKNNMRALIWFISIVTVLGILFIYAAKYHTIDIFNESLTSSGIKNKAVNEDIQFSLNSIKNSFKDRNDELNIHWLRVIKNYLRFPLDNAYGSHQLLLLAASILTADGGPVMELGCGDFSTTLLHQIIVLEQKRYLLSTDTDLQWLSKFEANMSSSLHEFRHVKEASDWDHIGTSRQRWSITLIDHKPGNRRTTDLIRVANISDIVILHDTELLYINTRQVQYYIPINIDILIYQLIPTY